MNKWGKSSKARLDTCHIDLQLIANQVLVFHDCSVMEGYRDEQTQNKYYDNGTSHVKFPDGKHNSKPSMAIDLAPYVPGVNKWDREYTLYFAGLVLGIADMMRSHGIVSHKLRWGGNWSTKRDKNFKEVGFYDGIHFELQ